MTRIGRRRRRSTHTPAGSAKSRNGRNSADSDGRHFERTWRRGRGWRPAGSPAARSHVPSRLIDWEDQASGSPGAARARPAAQRLRMRLVSPDGRHADRRLQHRAPQALRMPSGIGDERPDRREQHRQDRERGADDATIQRVLAKADRRGPRAPPSSVPSGIVRPIRKRLTALTRPEHVIRRDRLAEAHLRDPPDDEPERAEHARCDQERDRCRLRAPAKQHQAPERPRRPRG